MYADPSDVLWCRQWIGLNMVGTSTCMNETDVKDALHSAVKQCCVHAIEKPGDDFATCRGIRRL
jgi:hypothetical protein